MVTVVGTLVVYVLACAVLAMIGFLRAEHKQERALRERFERLTGRISFYLNRINAAQSSAVLYVNSMGKEETRALYELQLLADALIHTLDKCQRAAEQKDYFAFEQLMNELEAGEFIQPIPGVALQPSGNWEPQVNSMLTGVEYRTTKAQLELERLRNSVAA